ncbi:MAG: hypothetical protein LLG06_04945 [Desulfobacteraceae bacterium]|nr:hypothetical protein [Desulfobacteraceae bacterium]
MNAYREKVEGLIPIGEVFAAPITIGVNGHDEEDAGADRADAAVTAVRKMLAPVGTSNYFYPADFETRRKLVDLAWCNDPEDFESEHEWGEDAITKMREPAYQGWRLYINPANLKRLVEMV